LAAGAAFAPGALKIPFAALYGADAISEMFGGNLFGKNPNQPDNQQQSTASSAAKPPSPTPTIQPQQTMTGASSAPPPAPELPAPQVAPQETMTPATPGSINLDIKSLFSSSESASTDKKQDGSTQDFDQPPLYGSVNIPVEGKTSTEQAQVTPSASTPVIQPATLTTPPKQQPQVGPLPEPKPEITAINAAQQQQATPPPSQNVKTDVPLIRSSNPDNFWVLYSQVNYNVVM
jgi:hypothetical protein